VGALGFVVLGLRPSVFEELGFGFAADELRRGIFADAGDRLEWKWMSLPERREQAEKLINQSGA
jgi:hypothetical protein